MESLICIDERRCMKQVEQRDWFTSLLNNFQWPNYVKAERAMKGSGATGYWHRAPGAAAHEQRNTGRRGTRRSTMPLASVTQYTLIIYYDSTIHCVKSRF